MNALKLIGLSSLCLVTACAPHKMTPEFPFEGKAPLNEPQKALPGKAKASSISSWELSGAMAARNQKKGWSATLNWIQRGANQYQIRLFGPLGGGTVIIEKNDGVITYVDGPKKITSSNADDLLQKQTGVRLPVHDLYYWVRGMPAPGAVQSSHYEGTHLASLTQDGYVIHYVNYMSVNQVDLPSKIELQGHGVKIKLVIKHWKI